VGTRGRRSVAREPRSGTSFALLRQQPRQEEAITKQAQIARALSVAAALVGSTTLAVQPLTARPISATRVVIEQNLYPLVTDLNANGVVECLLLSREARTTAGGTTSVMTTIELVEPLPEGDLLGMSLRGRQFLHIPGGRFDLPGFEPLTGAFAEVNALIGSGQVRYGMCGMVTLPMRDVVTGVETSVHIFNTERGVFSFAQGEVTLEDIADVAVRDRFATVLYGDAIPAEDIRLAIQLHRPPGPLP